MVDLWAERKTLLCSSFLLSRRNGASRDSSIKGKVVTLGAHKEWRLWVQVAGALKISSSGLSLEFPLGVTTLKSLFFLEAGDMLRLELPLSWKWKVLKEGLGRIAQTSSLLGFRVNQRSPPPPFPSPHPPFPPWSLPCPSVPFPAPGRQRLKCRERA